MMNKLNLITTRLTVVFCIGIFLLTSCSSLPSDKAFAERMQKLPTVDFKSGSKLNTYNEPLSCASVYEKRNYLNCINPSKEALVGEYINEMNDGKFKVMMYNYNLKQNLCLPGGIFEFNVVTRQYTTIQSNIDLNQLDKQCDSVERTLEHEIYN